MDSTGIVGASTEQKSKNQAQKAAVEDCKLKGGVDCDSSFSYKNGCAAIAYAKGSGKSRFQSAATASLARKLALENCSSEVGTACEIFYTGCSDPEFRSY